MVNCLIPLERMRKPAIRFLLQNSVCIGFCQHEQLLQIVCFNLESRKIQVQFDRKKKTLLGKYDRCLNFSKWIFELNKRETKKNVAAVINVEK